MNAVSIKITEEDGLKRHLEPLQFGVPFPKGELYPGTQLGLTDSQHSNELPLAIQPLAKWPDGSVRWLQVNTRFSLTEHRQLNLTLQSTSEPEAEPERTDPGLVTTETFEHRIEQSPFRISTENSETGTQWHSALVLEDDRGHPLTAVLDSLTQPEHSNTLYSQRFISGYFLRSQQKTAFRFQGVLWFYHADGLVNFDLTLHNPQRARHPGGLWDLGDPGSLEFRHFGVHITSEPTTLSRLQPEPRAKVLETSASSDCHIYQDSSGGDNWQSQNHVDKNGKVTTRFRGYQVKASDVNTTGLRAQPVLEVSSSTGKVTAAIHQFWQNFPNALSTQKHGLEIGLFPRNSGQLYELQGGERKTHSVRLAFDIPLEELTWTQRPLVPVIPTLQYEIAQAFPWFKADTQPGPLDDLIKEGLEGSNNFFAKQEIIDEYGWRNFGDIFADHESLYQPEGGPPLVSHYNNQYDAIYGFARQFALTGDRRWFELMDDLARHVSDIDIYHTGEDRAEYNNGLFWHTDHYLPAHTATHRTFSRHNKTSSTPGQTGGGPAAEHCYTTGLTYHYFVTGCETSKQAVIDLANWMVTLHDGQPGLLTRLWAIKKDDLTRLKKHLKGEPSSPYQYPFTRGTGNYLTALVDAFEVTDDNKYLKKAEEVIQATLHPEDDIQQRGLLNVELCWSYLVILASITRYLELKNRLGQFDYAFGYARASLLHYTRWMRQNEQPFLADTTQLEFPNDTWVAQDIRKAILMFQALDLNPGETDAYRRQGEQWLLEVSQSLAKSPTRHFSRIQIILLQNFGPHVARHSFAPQAFTASMDEYGKAPKLTTHDLLTRLMVKGIKGLLEFRPSREKAWLDSRLNRS